MPFVIELEHSILLKQFHEFYSEVIRRKQEIRENVHAPLAPKPHSSVSPAGESAYPVFIGLLEILENQEREVRQRSGEYGVRFYKEGQYVMTALADEIFLHMDWEGREEWKSNLLEYKLFDTYVAGERFFARLDELLRERSPAYAEMAAIYFLALSLGFRGKFRDEDDGGQLAFYRRQLYAFIFRTDPNLTDASRLLFPQPYKNIFSDGGSKRLPRVRWWIVLAVCGVIFLIISHAIWNHLTGDLIQIAEDIIQKSGNTN
ncbi:DotU family type IV/VI secretion system protein [Desulfonema ishimotonii]|uniref:DotU family type IV/VI secretion system protein n=2 Tax=Desulfonema ishimotonii TaxID=45657 RepID=A0A401FYV3_9BACT|nr:DotU family type IV/VI secretion system protein [Desulfonema ishimotonii]